MFVSEVNLYDYDFGFDSDVNGIKMFKRLRVLHYKYFPLHRDMSDHYCRYPFSLLRK